MEVKTIFVATLVLCVGVLRVQSFSAGAPEGACKDLIPQHKTEPQKGNFPYTIKTNVSKIPPGGQARVTISSEKGTTFKGFMIQARIGETPYGTFQEVDNVKLINCSPGTQNTATHTSPSEKKSITLTWTAPAKLTGNVVFVATVAKDGGTFWVAEKSEPITIA